MKGRNVGLGHGEIVPCGAVHGGAAGMQERCRDGDWNCGGEKMGMCCGGRGGVSTTEPTLPSPPGKRC